MCVSEREGEGEGEGEGEISTCMCVFAGGRYLVFVCE